MAYLTPMVTWIEKTSPFLVAPQWFVEAMREGVPETEIRERVRVEIESALRFQAEKEGQEYGTRKVEDVWVEALFNLYMADYKQHSSTVM